jgi:hypothetical protein
VAVPLERVGERPPEPQTPVADRLVTDLYASGGQDRLDRLQAQADAMIKPDGMVNDLARKRKPPYGLGIVMSANLTGPEHRIE